MSDVQPESQPAPTVAAAQSERAHRAGSDLPFLALMGALGGGYILLILAMLAADSEYTSPAHFI
jgi:hypothetical protein